VLALQRTAGNHAVAQLLQRAPAFHGDGRHQPTDAAYGKELGTADAARLRKAGTLSPQDRADVNAKLRWFQGAGHAAYEQAVKPALVEVTQEPIDMSSDAEPEEPFTDAQLDRMGKANGVNVLFDSIEKLKNDRIATWVKTADTKEPKPLRYALEMAVASAALGFGGVFGAFIAQGLKDAHYLQEFVDLVGLEAGDKALEDAFHWAMESAGEAFNHGTMKALQARDANVAAALAGDWDNLLDTYAEAMRLQNRSETDAQQSAFNDNARSTYKGRALALKRGALQVTYNRLFHEPQVFHRELTWGLMRLMDEVYIAKQAADYGGDRKRALREDPDLHEVSERKGNLVLLGGDLGDYWSPRLNFPGFGGIGTGLNTKTLNKLAGLPVQDLPFTVGFRYFVENPLYWLLPGGDPVKAWFTRDADGNIYLDEENSGKGAKEWLASYYSGRTDKLSDEDRDRLAPLGAKKLYDATKDKPLRGASNTDLL